MFSKGAQAWVICLLSLFVFSFPVSVFSQSVTFSPSGGSYLPNQIFSIQVVVSSPNQAINAVSATIIFPADKLQVLSVSKSESVLNLWLQEPSFSNTEGTIKFEGAVFNPGFVGSGGKVVAVRFKSVGHGSANLKVVSASLLANDGFGTNILKTTGSASLALEAPPSPETVLASSSTEDAWSHISEAANEKSDPDNLKSTSDKSLAAVHQFNSEESFIGLGRIFTSFLDNTILSIIIFFILVMLVMYSSRKALIAKKELNHIK